MFQQVCVAITCCLQHSMSCTQFTLDMNVFRVFYPHKGEIMIIFPTREAAVFVVVGVLHRVIIIVRVIHRVSVGFCLCLCASSGGRVALHARVGNCCCVCVFPHKAEDPPKSVSDWLSMKCHPG